MRSVIPAHKGEFHHFDGRISVDFDHPPQSRVSFNVETQSVDVGSASFDDYLRSEAFLNADRFKQIAFVSTAVEKINEHEIHVTGDLTMLGVTKPLTVDVEVNRQAGQSRARLGFTARAKIDRLAFGMNSGFPVISRDVDLLVASEAVENDGHGSGAKPAVLERDDDRPALAVGRRLSSRCSALAGSWSTAISTLRRNSISINFTNRWASSAWRCCCFALARVSPKGRQLFPAAMPDWEQRLAALTHVAFYVLLAVAAFSGWLLVSAAIIAIPTRFFNLFVIPNLGHADATLQANMTLAHYVVSRLLMALVALHVVAALKHHFLDRDDIMRRMLGCRDERSAQAAVDDQALFGDHRAVVGGEKQRHPRDFVRQQHPMQALPVDERLEIGFADPEPALALRADGARRDGVDANIVLAERPGEAVGQADDRGFGRRIGRQRPRAAHPGDRGKIDDRTGAEFAHMRAHGLRGEELMLDVETHRAVPIRLGHRVDVLAGIVGGIVDEHADRPEALANLATAARNAEMSVDRSG